ncbi:unnamed protein product [Litomosoides sigmodontis]|uniref:Uncharacterized protein n=1 Tax=Litomosoides sigmodontis TaxID=42156 RepID=A0A3P6TF84_LITSI|nr:unnamed protein product [Litomosoides sigmodontis]VDK88205.1 unnamed protein product [Litomosoides sigmodontis]
MQSSYALGLAVLTMATAPKILDALSGDVDTEFGAAFAAYLSGFISNWLFTLVLWHHYWYIEQKLKATSLKHVPLNGYCCKDIKRKDRNECEKCGEEKHAGTACTSEVSSSSEYNKREEREHDETTCGSEVSCASRITAGCPGERPRISGSPPQALGYTPQQPCFRASSALYEGEEKEDGSNAKRIAGDAKRKRTSALLICNFANEVGRSGRV